jgi:DNA polymerase elongation subunit (family B)
MSKFYTNVQSIGNSILYRGIEDGRKIKQKIVYQPSLYIPSKKITSITSLEGDYLDEKKFLDIKSARDYIKQFDGVSGAPKIYGQTRFEYAFIADQSLNGMVDYNTGYVNTCVIDIEVGSENGFPDPYKANEPITAICIKNFSSTKRQTAIVFGCGEFESEGFDAIHIRCKDETDLCKRFLKMWQDDYPDIVTGWNTKFFDIPYLVNRFKKILGETETKKLSPWNYITERNVYVNNRQMIDYTLVGISSLDYIELYKWYAPGGKSQESYRLDNIAQVELSEGKLSYDDYDNLNALYRLNYQKFIEYNIKDVELILKLEDKLKLVELAITLAYDTKSNFEDVFAQTRMWDALTYSYLSNKNIIVPPRVIKEKDSAFEGAYVKEVQVGKHDYVASFDLNSLYPHLMMQYSISPENLVERSYIEDRKQKLIQELRSRNL